MKATSNDLTLKYSKGIIAIHWLSMILLIGLFCMGKYLDSLNLNAESKLVKAHGFLGIFALLLTLTRIFLLTKSKTQKLKTGYKWNDIFMKIIHYGFYFVIIGICLSGMIFMNTGIRGAMKVHSILAGTLILLVILHVGGIIKHLILTKENALKRIT